MHPPPWAGRSRIPFRVSVRSADDATGDPAAAAAECRGLVAVVVAAGVDDQRMTLELRCILDARRGQALGGCAVGGNVQYRQIAVMALAVRAFVPAGVIGVPMAARRAGRDGIAVGGGRAAGAIFMHMETVRARWQPPEVQLEHRAAGARRNDDVT